MHYKKILLGLIVPIAATAWALPVAAATLDLATSPLFLSNQVPPSLVMLLDNSGAMKIPLYRGSGGTLDPFDPAKNYAGLFDAAKTYQYDTTIPVDTTAYKVNVDTSTSGAFVESSCTASATDNTCWSGNFLNWLTTRRIDALRKNLVGGKVENRSGHDYLGNGSLQYKLIGNNEPGDTPFSGSSPLSAQYSPVADNQLISVYSPASSGAIRPSYRPYAQLAVVGSNSGFIYDNGGAKIGEFGDVNLTTTVDSGKNLLPSSWTHVTFRKSYTVAPIVVAKSPSYNETNGGVVRIRNVTYTGFDIAFQEWPSEDGNHASEQVHYLVVEPGNHTLPGGLKMEARTTTTSSRYQSTCPGSVRGTTTLGFNQSFSLPPIVLTSVTTFNDPDAVTSRVWNVSTSNFTMALQEQQDGSNNTSEDVAYVAIEPGSVIPGGQPFFLEAGRIANMSDGQTVTFTNPFPATPAFLAALQTMNDRDPTVLRSEGIDNDAARIRVQEETSCDPDVTHLPEGLGYLALSNVDSVHNIAVLTSTPPEGVVQQSASSIRLGLSFHRYEKKSADIYHNNLSDGGTLKFHIPDNPFVKNPSDPTLPAPEQGYRHLDGYVGNPIEELVDAIEHYPLIDGTSPLAENLWEVIRYFSQNNPHYDSSDFDLADAGHPERDPYYQPASGTTQECTRAQVLILSSGKPLRDANLPNSLLDYDSDGNVASNCTDALTQDQDCVSSDPIAFGHDNLDDVAYWGFCDTSQGSCINSVTGLAETPSRDLRGDLPGNQFLRVDTVSFAGAAIPAVLQETADNAGGTAQAAEDGLALGSALNQILTTAKGSTSATVAVNTGSIQSNSRLFLARFDNDDWSGNLLAFQINPDGSLAQTLDANGLSVPQIPPGWEAASNIPSPSSRVIVTYDGVAGKPFRWPQLSAAQKTSLDAANAGNPTSPILNWLRGDHTDETQNGGPLRTRGNTVLGDIVHSAPAFVGPPDFHYPDDLEGSSHPYSAFRTAKADRLPMVYVGANDGMLHGFDAATGVEKFAYVPNEVYPRLADLSQPNYLHQYSVDGSPTVVDSFFGNAWHTVLVAGLRAGGQAVYALDVSDPAGFANEASASSQVLWEFSDDNDPDLGLTFSTPNVVRLYNGEWSAVFGNGYNNTVNDLHASGTGNAVLFIVRLSDGALIRKIDTGVGTSHPASGGKPNGLATVAPVDVDGDAIADYVYAGDLLGHLWKFDLTATTASNWKVAYSTSNCDVTGTCTPLFTACSGDPCTTGNRQPVTVRPQVSKHPTQPGYLVFFGTGKYLENSDNSVVGQLTQSFYAIWDKKNESTLAAFGRANLQQRKILAETSAFGTAVRVTSGISDDTTLGGGAIDWNTQRGWYLDLINTEGGNTNNGGERVVADPIFRNGRIIFTTLIPSSDPCASGGTGWLMELDAGQGIRLANSPFDINRDGTFNVMDKAGVSWDVNGNGQLDAGDVAAISGVKSTVGIIMAPGIANDQSGNKEFKYNSGSSGNVQITPENPGSGRTGRLSWRQIR